MLKLHLITFASVFQKKEEEAIREAHHELFDELDKHFDVRVTFGEDDCTPLRDALVMVFIATGGTEGMVVQHYDELPHPLVLLTDGKANSLAASLELSCWVRQQGDECRIFHDKPHRIIYQINEWVNGQSASPSDAPDQQPRLLQGLRIGVFGEPSDWLVSSGVDYELARKRWGVEYVDISLSMVNAVFESIPVDEQLQQEADVLLGRAAGCVEPSRQDLLKALRLYKALKGFVTGFRLDAITIQCFSLIPTTCTTGCLALSLLNDEGIIAGCEGDLQSIFTMLLAHRLTGEIPFMANPSYIDENDNEVLFAHCTIGLQRCHKYILRSHFESQSGVAIQGLLPEGPVTVLKVGGKALNDYFVTDAQLLENQDDPRKCRTQILVKLLTPHAAKDYFLSRCIGNHHIIIPGHHAHAIQRLMEG